MASNITPIRRRIIDQPIDDPTEIGYLHAILCMCGLPRSRVNGSTFTRTNGSASLLMTEGALWDRKTGSWVTQPLPYGTRPRLAMIHISAEAVRTKNPVVDVGSSVREFLIRLGINHGGTELRLSLIHI